MAVYYDSNLPAMSTTGYAYVADAFLSLGVGVEQFFGEKLRLSYAIWEEEKVDIQPVTDLKLWMSVSKIATPQRT